MPTTPPDVDNLIKNIFPGANKLKGCPRCGGPAVERKKYNGGTFWFCESCPRLENGKNLAWNSDQQWHQLKSPREEKITHGAAAWIQCNMGHTMASNETLCTQCWGEDGGDPSGYVRAVEAVNPGQKWDHERKYVGDPEPEPDWL